MSQRSSRRSDAGFSLDQADVYIRWHAIMDSPGEHSQIRLNFAVFYGLNRRSIKGFSLDWTDVYIR